MPPRANLLRSKTLVVEEEVEGEVIFGSFLLSYLKNPTQMHHRLQIPKQRKCPLSEKPVLVRFYLPFLTSKDGPHSAPSVVDPEVPTLTPLPNNAVSPPL